jgi:glycosyltransferase involved in cell wall biosynthesis
MTTCSVVVTNYNYGRFLRDAVDSALAQTWPKTEVVVVDDGSTDDSRSVIDGYGDRVTAVFKGNGGQASAFNAGASAAVGDVVVFLDADDVLHEDAVETAMEAFTDGVVKVHWPLQRVNADGARLGGLVPSAPLPAGDLSAAVLAGGPTSSLSAPTSGNAWRRAFLERVLPVPEGVDYYRACADEYLYTLAPMFGTVAAIERPLGCYRLHGSNVYSSRDAREKLAMELDGHGQQCQALAATLDRNGIAVDLEAWRHNSWFHRLARAIDTIGFSVPPASSFALADGDTWAADELFEPRRVVPVSSLTVEGGPPMDDDAAIAILPGLVDAEYVVFGWPSFWWFDHYPRFTRELGARFDVIIADDVVRIWKRRVRRP